MDTPNLYIYWAHDTGMMSPTLQMARTYLKRRLPIKKATLSTWISVSRILQVTVWALASLTAQTACKGHFALGTEYAAMVLKGLHWGQRWSYTTWSNGFANEDFLCVSPMALDGVFFSHPQAGRNSTEFWTLPSLKSALQTHEGPTETPKGHSVHGRKALEKWKPISETEGTNHYSLSANNQPINEWVNRSIGRSTNQSNIDGSIDQSTNRLMKLSTDPNCRANNRI